MAAQIAASGGVPPSQLSLGGSMPLPQQPLPVGQFMLPGGPRPPPLQQQQHPQSLPMQQQQQQPQHGQAPPPASQFTQQMQV